MALTLLERGVMSTNHRIPSSPDLSELAAASSLVRLQTENDDELVIDLMSCLAPLMGSESRGPEAD